MTKLIVIPHNNKTIKKLIKIADGYILSIRDLSTNSTLNYDLKEIKTIIKYLNKHHKEIFISLNKNIHNSDLDYLKYILMELDKYNITGILYYDIGLVNLHHKLGLKTNLVWSQEHQTTNSTTCNYWYSKGIKYTYLSADITLVEIRDIKENTKMELMVPIFGYLPMMVSQRRLVNNYLNYCNIPDDSLINYMQAGDNIYPLVDDEDGTFAYSAHILNGLEAYMKLQAINFDYVTLNEFNIEAASFIKIVKIFKEVNADNVKRKSSIITRMFKNADSGFLYKETIYKVKNNDEKN